MPAPYQAESLVLGGWNYHCDEEIGECERCFCMLATIPVSWYAIHILNTQQQQEASRLAREFINSLTPREFLLEYCSSKFATGNLLERLKARIATSPIKGFGEAEYNSCLQKILIKKEEIVDKVNKIFGANTPEANEVILGITSEANRIFNREPILELKETRDSQGISWKLR